MNQFTQRYQAFSNPDLLKVIENQSDYQAEAYEAAKAELARRMLSDEDLKEAHEQLEAEENERKLNAAKRSELEEKAKKIGSGVVDFMKPFQDSKPNTEKTIMALSITFGLLAILQWYREFEMFSSLFDDSLGDWDLSVFEYLFPLFLVPLATLLFWLRKKNGWIILTAYLCYTVLSSLGSLIITLNTRAIDIAANNSLFDRPSTGSQILSIVFYASILWLINKPEIKSYFKISKKTSLATLGISIVVCLLIVMPLFLV